MKRLTHSLLISLLLLLLPLIARAEGDPVPTQAADPAPSPIRLVPEEGLPLPSEAYPLTEKRSFVFGGTVVSETPLTRVSVTVSDPKGNVLLSAEGTPDPAEDMATRFPLWDKTYPFEDESLSARTDFASLKPGDYVFTLKAANSAAKEVTLYSSPFTVTAFPS